jgi:uncharacterized Zn finger protein
MFFYSKKLVKCCKCGKQYSFDDNLYEHNGDYILQCPFCGLQHKVDISLLSKRYSDLKKIEKLNLTAIDIGNEAINRPDSLGIGSHTHIVLDNPANASGTITSVEIWAATASSDVEVATFYNVSGSNYSTRDYETIGAVTAGSKQTFTVSLNVEEGDYIGIKGTAGSIDITAGVGTDGYAVGDCIPCTNTSFASASRTLSLYGTGEVAITAGNPLFIFQNF